MIRYKTGVALKTSIQGFESFVNLIRYKTVSEKDITVFMFESFVNLIRYKTEEDGLIYRISLRALLI